MLHIYETRHLYRLGRFPGNPLSQKWILDLCAEDEMLDQSSHLPPIRMSEAGQRWMDDQTQPGSWFLKPDPTHLRKAEYGTRGSLKRKPGYILPGGIIVFNDPRAAFTIHMLMVGCEVLGSYTDYLGKLDNKGERLRDRRA